MNQTRSTQVMESLAVLETGDVVYTEIREVHLPNPIRMAFLGPVGNGKFAFLIPFSVSVTFDHNGHFDPEQFTLLELEYKAERAIPRETWGEQFSQHEPVTVKATGIHGTVIAAIDGTVAIRCEDGALMVGLEIQELERRRETAAAG